MNQIGNALIKIAHSILLVEDNPLTVKLVKLTLETEGYDVFVCNTGAEAIAYLLHATPDLILQDMRLPDTDGLTLIKTLRGLPNLSGVPIIAFSGFTSMIEEARIANSGFSDFLIKPVEPSLLSKCVANHLLSFNKQLEKTNSVRVALILDDDPLQLKFTALQFSYAGFDVITGADGEEGLLLAEKYHPDVIISDVLMPKMDGFQFCKTIRKNPVFRDIPIVLVSANYVEEIDGNLATKIGANAYVYRSLGIQKVIDTVLDSMNDVIKHEFTYQEDDTTNVDGEIHGRMLQQLERQVSLNLASRQRNYVQHTLLGQIGVIADTLLQQNDSNMVLDDILARCLDSAGLSHGVFYYGDSNKPLNLRAQYGFKQGLNKADYDFGYPAELLDITQNSQTIAIPSNAMDKSISDAILTRADSHSALLVPIVGGAGMQGLLIMFSDEHLLLEDDWIAFGHNVAAQFTQATELSDTFSRLVESEQRFQQLAENINEVFFLLAPSSGKILYLSPAYETIWGRSRQSLIDEPTTWVDSVVAEDRPIFIKMLHALKSTGQFSEQFRITCSNGYVKWVLVKGLPIFDNQGVLSRVAGTAEDITARKKAEEHIQRLNRLYALLSGINILIVRTENQTELFNEACRIAVEIGEFDLAWIGFINFENNNITPSAKYGPQLVLDEIAEIQFSINLKSPNQTTLINRAIQHGTPQYGHYSQDDVNHPPNMHALQRQDYQSVICLPLKSEANVIGIAKFYSKRQLDFDSREIKLITEMASDISFALDFLKTKERLQYLAYHDPLTGLANRTTLKQRLESRIENRDRLNGVFGLILININSFRDINDTLGHENGDILLNEIALRILKESSETDLVACLGGDEFAILVPQLDEEKDLIIVANKVKLALQVIFQVAQVPLHIEARMGLALYPCHGMNATSLWRHADIALSAARKNKEFICIYNEDYDHFDPTNLALLGELRNGIAQNELVLHWQPKLNLHNKQACGVEALVRWQHPTRGLLYPDSFIPFVEHTALIKPLTRWVIEKAIHQTKQWDNLGFKLDVAINLSVRNLQESDIDSYILAIAEAEDFPIEQITLEITESAVMENIAEAKLALSKLRQAGIKIAMDDFGIGQSSLTYLKDLPITNMKIDKSFVMDLHMPGNSAIVKSAIDLAHNLHLTVTAEGVENIRALEELEILDCDVAQGYFISKPMAAKDLAEWLTSSRWPCEMKSELCQLIQGN